MRRAQTLTAAAGAALALTGTPAAAAIATCSSTGICFYRSSPDDLPFTGFSQSIARGVCRGVLDNQTHYVQNNTRNRWYVFRTTNCTGARAAIYPHTSGYMAGVWDRSIGSTYRTASLT